MSIESLNRLPKDKSRIMGTALRLQRLQQGVPMGHIMNEDASQIDITHYLSKGEIQHLLPEGRHVNHLAAEIALNPDEEPYIGKHL